MAGPKGLSGAVKGSGLSGRVLISTPVRTLLAPVVNVHLSVLASVSLSAGSTVLACDGQLRRCEIFHIWLSQAVNKYGHLNQGPFPCPIHCKIKQDPATLAVKVLHPTCFTDTKHAPMFSDLFGVVQYVVADDYTSISYW